MRAKLFALATLSFASVAACTGASAAPGQFDLLCKGQMTRNGATSAFDTRMHVDLGAGRACFDVCLTTFAMTEATDARLAYHWQVAERGPPDGAVNLDSNTLSSAGPSPQGDDFSVDRRTGAYQRTYRYDAGDPAAVAYTESYTGQCQVMPFTGLAALVG
ncbi:MAG TPA: hypothetical protein VHW60_15075 [Caulobacteraceae bacterium]|jgi:hypothetical protein|nr:hypothetical protein [Caulobacteraceae bacterium]